MKSIQIRSAALAVAMMGIAAPVLAQDAICGGAGSNGQWIGGNEAASDISTASTYQEQMALVLGGNEYVALFNLSQPTNVRVEAAGRGAGDPLIDLLDSSGNIILSDDDSGGNGAARGEVDLQPGTYCMSLRSYDGAPMTAFVRVGTTDQEPLTAGLGEASTETTDPNTSTTSSGGASCSTARALGGNDMITAGVSGTGSVDEVPYWGFSLSAPMSVSITAENETADPVITLYGPGDTYLNENDDYDGLNSRLDMTNPLPAGDYCVEMAALNDTTLPITISLSEYDPEAALAELYARGEAAPPLDGSVPMTDLGKLSNRLRQDVQTTDEITWFTVDISDSSLLVVEAIAAGGNGDPWLVVFDDLGREVGQNDDYGDGLDSLVTVRVSTGTYIVGVKQLGEGMTGFVRLVFERYVPAP